LKSTEFVLLIVGAATRKRMHKGHKRLAMTNRMGNTKCLD